jgi:DNA polymerase sigma
LVTTLLDVGRGACGEKATLNSAQLKTVLKVAAEALRLTQRHSPEDVQNIWKADPWQSLKNELVRSKRFENASGLHQICDQIAKAIESPDSDSKVKAKKRKITDAQPIPENREIKRKKVKGST